jgi:hypothetical protein
VSLCIIVHSKVTKYTQKTRFKKLNLKIKYDGVQVNVAVLLGAPRDRAQAELKAGKLTMRVHRYILFVGPFKLYSELKKQRIFLY